MHNTNVRRATQIGSALAGRDVERAEFSTKEITDALRRKHSEAIQRNTDMLQEMGLQRIVNEVGRGKHRQSEDVQLSLFPEIMELPYLTLASTLMQDGSVGSIRKVRENLTIGDLRFVSKRSIARKRLVERRDPYTLLLERIDSPDLDASMNIIDAIKMQHDASI